MSEHKQKGFSVNDSHFNEFLGYVGEYITKSTLMRNVVVDKSNKRYVNLQQKRSGPPEEASCTILLCILLYQNSFKMNFIFQSYFYTSWINVNIVYVLKHMWFVLLILHILPIDTVCVCLFVCVYC